MLLRTYLVIIFVSPLTFRKSSFKSISFFRSSTNASYSIVLFAHWNSNLHEIKNLSPLGLPWCIPPLFHHVFLIHHKTVSTSPCCGKVNLIYVILRKRSCHHDSGFAWGFQPGYRGKRLMFEADSTQMNIQWGILIGIVMHNWLAH